MWGHERKIAKIYTMEEMFMEPSTKWHLSARGDVIAEHGEMLRLRFMQRLVARKERYQWDRWVDLDVLCRTISWISMWYCTDNFGWWRWKMSWSKPTQYLCAEAVIKKTLWILGWYYYKLDKLCVWIIKTRRIWFLQKNPDIICMAISIHRGHVFPTSSVFTAWLQILCWMMSSCIHLYIKNDFNRMPLQNLLKSENLCKSAGDVANEDG